MKCLKDNLLESIPSIFVSKNEISNELKELGFEVEGIAHILPRNFTSPKIGIKKHTINERSEVTKRKKVSSDCDITVAMT